MAAFLHLCWRARISYFKDVAGLITFCCLVNARYDHVEVPASEIIAAPLLNKAQLKGSNHAQLKGSNHAPPLNV